MSQVIDILARAVARSRGRIVPLRTASAIAPDEAGTFGFAPIKVVSEEVIQAIAFGDLGREPIVVTRWNPLSRDAAAFDEFAAALDKHLETELASSRLPRLWVPHLAALKLLELLGHRYRTNREAPETLRRMGGQCRVLAEEARHPGQQAVMVATTILTTHAATGQAPTEDNHLGALLAWHEADGSYAPSDEADRRARVPAASMLERELDDRVEALRPVAKAGGSRAAAARPEIEEILRLGALREWDLLVGARRAFEALELPAGPGTLRLAEVSRKRLEWSLGHLPSPASRPAALGKLLDEHEFGAALVEDADMTDDMRMRERARRAGKVVAAEVVAIAQPRRNCKPCTLTLRTRQGVLRVRPGSELRSADRVLVGRVEAMRREPDPAAQLIDLSLTQGLRSVPSIGIEIDWLDSVPFDGRIRRAAAYRAAQDAGAFTLIDSELPSRAPRDLDDGDLAAVAERLRRA